MPEWLIALVTLSVMEIVLGIDNIIFIAIIAGRVAPEKRARARQLGLLLALGTRLILLFSLTWVMSLKDGLFMLPDLSFLHMSEEARAISGRDLILLIGGLFLIAKSVHEIHEKLEGEEEHASGGPSKVASFGYTLAQIAVVDIIFSLDSVITAIGMVREDQLWVMITAMVIAVGVMMAFAGSVSNFVDKHPTVKMLALSFLILIGVILLAEGCGQHIDKGYVYFAMAFSVVVELLNIRLRKKPTKPVSLHERKMPHEPTTGPKI